MMPYRDFTILNFPFEFSMDSTFPSAMLVRTVNIGQRPKYMSQLLLKSDMIDMVLVYIYALILLFQSFSVQEYLALTRDTWSMVWHFWVNNRNENTFLDISYWSTGKVHIYVFWFLGMIQIFQSGLW